MMKINNKLGIVKVIILSPDLDLHMIEIERTSGIDIKTLHKESNLCL